MRKIALLLTIAMAVVVSSCSKYSYEEVEGDPTQTRIYTLDNGLKVYMSVNDEAPRIQTYIAVKVGGKNDPAETTGLAHYFEHLMFKGTEKFGTQDYAKEKPYLDEIERLFEVYRKTTDEAERKVLYATIDSVSYEASKISIPNEYDKLMSAIGAQGTNAYTSTDMTVYVEDIPSNQIENWAMIQADRFQNAVIRGFHTELETVYEEKNMSLTQDNRKVFTAVDEALFPNHPYGTQTVLGTQEQLKNPSITNIKEYFKTYYVPNNIAICLSGDFDPDQMIATIDKYFGVMEPNPNLPKLEFEAEKPIESPVEKEVYGLESESVVLAWRYPGQSTESATIAELVSAVLTNGKAGLLDLNLNQQQKVLGSYSFAYSRPDYGEFFVGGDPKQGQSLDEVRDLVLAEVAKLRNGEFDDELLEATVNNYKLEQMSVLENNSSRADLYVNAFINGESWESYVNAVEDLSKITKQDVVDWANKYLKDNNYAIVRKLQGEDPNIQKIDKPHITPIETNRDKQSDMLTAVQNTVVTPIEPKFVDYTTDLSVMDHSGAEVLYKQNTTNDKFSLYYRFKTGLTTNPKLDLYTSYIEYLGTPTRSAEERAKELYALACDIRVLATPSQSYIIMSGLSENMAKSMEIFEDWIANAQADEQTLANLKADVMKQRDDSKYNQSANFSALKSYVQYGGDYIRKTTLTNGDLVSLGSEELLQMGRDLLKEQHTIMYYGPMSEQELEEALATYHPIDGELKEVEIVRPESLLTPENKVFVAQYDANQIYYTQMSNRGEKYDSANDADLQLYNTYFGGGMNAIVFQEMREARGLAYSAWTQASVPSYADGTYSYIAFIATQNDKMVAAIKAFDEIINNMPLSEKAFDIAKESILSGIRTDRYVGSEVLWSYINAQDMGLTEDRNKAVFEKVQNMTLEDVVATQQKWVKDRKYHYCILGDMNNIDMDYLKSLGEIEIVQKEEMFGY